MKRGGRLVSSAIAAIALMLAVDVHAASFKHELLGTSTEFDTIAVGSDGTHIILDNYNTGEFYYLMIDPSGRVRTKTLLSFVVQSAYALAVDSQNLPHLIYTNYTLGAETNYATTIGGNWTTQPVPNPGCFVIDSIALDRHGNLYVPCVWEASPGNNFASLLIYDGSNWTREDAATTRFDATAEINLTPNGPAFVSIDSGGAIHLEYGLSGNPSFPGGYVRDLCDNIRKPGSYAESCGTVASADTSYLFSAVVGPAGDSHFAYFTSLGQASYAHFDGTSWSTEPFGTVAEGQLAVDSNDIPKIAFVQDLTQEEALFYSVRTPQGWQTQAIGGDPGVFHPSIKLDTAGVPHIGVTAAANGGREEAVFAFLSEPDLTAHWNDIGLTTVRGKSVLLGHLKVVSDATASANGFHIDCYLSDRAVLSASDPVIGKASVSLAAGASRVITFDFDPSVASSGKYVIARVITKPGEANPNNNTAAIMIP